tara:strand:- start:88048 stop:88359 length:312 start_codon:yes stop_codon:yes gene_type:complete
MNQNIIKYFKELHEHVKYYNRMSPFPVYDTEYVEEIKKHIEKMENEMNYNELPVVACKYCKSLHVIHDEDENDICMRCGSVNEIEFYDNIEDYFDKIQPHEKY